MSLTFVSLFSGVGGFDLGLERAGWRCVAQVEWDKQCQAVLARHWPDVPKWSDVSDVYACRCRPLQPRTDGGSALLVADGAGARGTSCPCGGIPAADVVAFGSPCQDLSVAGRRAGFVEGGRSNLFFEAIRIIKEMRSATGTLPRFVVWENVVGALSSNQGDDFAAVIDALGEVGAVDISWRVLDARWFGVPQRRRRVFVVADLAGRCAGAVSAEPEGVRWHSDEGGASWPGDPDGAARSLASGGVFGQSGFARYTEGVTPLRATDHKRPEDNIVVGSLQSRMSKGPNAEGAADGHLVVSAHHTHTQPLSRQDSLVAGLTPHTPAPVGWSATEKDIAAPLLVSQGGLRTTDVDGATWVVEK